MGKVPCPLDSPGHLRVLIPGVMRLRKVGWGVGSVLLLAAGSLGAAEAPELPDDAVFKRALAYQFGQDAGPPEVGPPSRSSAAPCMSGPAGL